VLYLAGKEKTDVEAWAAQFLRGKDTSFPADISAWTAMENALHLNRIFQGGADTYSWDDLWLRFRQDTQAWFYAPLGRIRNLRGDQTDNLAADIFPPGTGETGYGIQAEMLWLTPLGSAKSREKLRALWEWARSGETETALANALGWIPANPQGRPYNAVCYQAQLAWLRSSYVWTVQE
jgi:hypothetical protein